MSGRHKLLLLLPALLLLPLLLPPLPLLDATLPADQQHPSSMACREPEQIKYSFAYFVKALSQNVGPAVQGCTPHAPLRQAVLLLSQSPELVPGGEAVLLARRSARPVCFPPVQKTEVVEGAFRKWQQYEGIEYDTQAAFVSLIASLDCLQCSRSLSSGIAA